MILKNIKNMKQINDYIEDNWNSIKYIKYTYYWKASNK